MNQYINVNQFIILLILRFFLINNIHIYLRRYRMTY